MIRFFRSTRSVPRLLGVVLVLAVSGGNVRATDEATTPAASSDFSQAPPTSESSSAQQEIERHLAIGNSLLGQGEYEGAQAEYRAILQLDATHPEALRLMTKTQQQREAAQARAQQSKGRLRNQALDLALQVAREKAKAHTQQEAHARTQLARAREQQLKLLYHRGVALYRQGQYQGAIDLFQQMVPLDPAHPLVQEARRLIARAETKHTELRARVAARASPGQGGALVSELEQQLTQKRIEIETVLKYARIAMKERNYDMAVGLLQRVLAQDPRQREPQQLLEQAQLARLKNQEDQLKRQVHQDEQAMINEVVKAQILPAPSVQPVTLPLGPPVAQGFSAKLHEPISLDFTDVALGDVVEFIADAANVSIIPSPQLDLDKRRVSLKVTQLPLELALKYLAKSQSLAYRIEQDAILIATPEEFSSEPMDTRVFFMRNGLGPFALEAAALEPNPAVAMESIKVLIEKSIPQPPDSKLVMDQRTGALIVTNTVENLALVERLLSQLDTTPVQVLIEARFVELTMTELEQLGLESVLTGDYALTKEGAAGGGLGPGNVIAKGGGAKFPALSREDEGLNFTLEGVLSGLQFEAVLHALEETKKSKTLSAPRVTTLNNQTATIRVVEEFNYPTKYEVSLIQFDINGDGDFDDAGETEFANVPQDFQKRDVGILLNVTPSIGKDLKMITLVLSPEVSQFSQFRNLGGGVTVPEFTSSQLTTSVVIENGQTVVLGGLMKDTTTSQVTKIPVLGDLPFIGGAFRQKEDTSTRKNLLIFITARLLAPRQTT